MLTAREWTGQRTLEWGTLQWIDNVRQDLPLQHRRPLAYYVRGIVHHNYTYLGRMYRKYKTLMDRDADDDDDDSDDDGGDDDYDDDDDDPPDLALTDEALQTCHSDGVAA